jgi:hypothetical protein
MKAQNAGQPGADNWVLARTEMATAIYALMEPLTLASCPARSAPQSA